MKIFKRNQIIILVISLMLITAGYLNFTSNNKNEIQTSLIASRDDETIGDAQLVTANIYDEKSKDQVENVNSENTSCIADNTIQTADTTKTTDDTYYFETSKLERNNMYSELLETYQNVYNNTNSTNVEKDDAINKITAINNTKNAIMICENLIKAKGFENVIIFVNDNSASVVVKTKELTTEQVAQIQNIITRELKIEANSIHISNKCEE
jgi:stage III sporulation protein AH